MKQLPQSYRAQDENAPGTQAPAAQPERQFLNELGVGAKGQLFCETAPALPPSQREGLPAA